METDSYYSTSDTIRKEFLRKTKNIKESKSERLLQKEKQDELEKKLFGPRKCLLKSIVSYSSLNIHPDVEPMDSIRYGLREVNPLFLTS